jgi:hypothetical protein
MGDYDLAGRLVTVEGRGVRGVVVEDAGDDITVRRSDGPDQGDEFGLEVDRSEVVAPSWHSRQKWSRYVGPSDDPLAVLEAWEKGEPIRRDHGLDAEEVRLDPETEALLLRKGETIVTTIPLDHANPQTADAAKEVMNDGR